MEKSWTGWMKIKKGLSKKVRKCLSERSEESPILSARLFASLRVRAFWDSHAMF
jgi:hypothetical protein